MKPSPARSRFSTKFFWIAVLIALFAVTIAWFVNPLATIEGDRKPEPVANPTEWTVAPSGPAVEVRLPETPLKNRPVGEPEDQR
jgi:hypothetical protein